MTTDVATENAPSNTQLPDPLVIDFVAALFTSRNRAATFLRRRHSPFETFVNNLALLLESMPCDAEDLREIAERANRENADDLSIVAQVITMLAPYIYEANPILDRRLIANALKRHARQICDMRDRSETWFDHRFLPQPGFFSYKEDRVAWNLCASLVPLFELNTVVRCTSQLWVHHEPHAPLIAAAPIELIELWLAVPSARPSIEELRTTAADRLATNLPLTVAAGIYLNFASAFGQLNDEDREHVAAILRRYTQEFASYARSPLTGCSHAMHLTLCDLLNEAQFTYLFHLGPGHKNYAPMALAFQIIFLAFYNASMMIPEDCRPPRGSEAFGEEEFPKLRKALGEVIVPEIIA